MDLLLAQDTEVLADVSRSTTDPSQAWLVRRALLIRASEHRARARRLWEGSRA